MGTPEYNSEQLISALIGCSKSCRSLIGCIKSFKSFCSGALNPILGSKLRLMPLSRTGENKRIIYRVKCLDKIQKWNWNKDSTFLRKINNAFSCGSCISIGCIIVFHNTLFIKALNEFNKTTYITISGFLLVIRKIKPGVVLLKTFRSNFEFFLTSPTAQLKRIQN